MATITFDIPDPIAVALAFGRGWRPFVEDTSQEMDGDSYPMMPNPVTFEQHASAVAKGFMQEYVLGEARKRARDEFTSIYDAIEDRLKKGHFDALLLEGDIAGVKEMVKATL